MTDDPLSDPRASSTAAPADAASDSASPTAPAPPPRSVAESRPRPGRDARPELLESRDPLYRELQGYRLRLDPPDLARLRELPGSKGKTDRELGEQFFEGQSARLAAALAEDVPAPAEIRVVVDPYSRQVFLALESRIRAIVSF